MERTPVWIACLLLFLVNALTAGELFFTEYTSFPGSIEAAYIGLSRQILLQWPEYDWFPLWYGGIPFQNTYPPLLHFLVAGFAALTGTTTALAHHAVSAFFYCLGPVSVYLLAWRLSGSRGNALIAGVLYSAISPAAWLIGGIRADMGTIWASRRLHALVVYGEGPHITALALLPLAITAFHEAVERSRRVWWVIAAAAVALLPLTNWLGAFALAAMLAAYLLSRTFPLGWNVWVKASALAVFAYALAMPWIPPSTLAAIRINSQRIGGDFQLGQAQLLAAAGGLILLLLAAWGMHRLRLHWYGRFAVLSVLLLSGITLAAEWFQFYLVPQPHRYHLEMEIAFVLLAAWLLVHSVRRVRWIAALVAVLAAVGLTFSTVYAWKLIQPMSMAGSTEHVMARAFEEKYPNGRVFAPGSVGFWLQAFSNTAQLGGGFDQGLTNQLLPVASYQIYSGENAGESAPEIAIAWLEALGVDAVGVTGPGSTESFQDFRDVNKFEGLLPKVWEGPGASIYEIPKRNRSLAWVIRPEDVPEQTPNSGLDIAAFSNYRRGLRDPALPLASFDWRSPSEAQIRTNMHPGQRLSIQITWQPGWSAFVDGKRVEVQKDALNQILLAPILFT